MIDLINSTIYYNWPMLVLVVVIYCIFRFFYLTSSRRKVKIFEEIYQGLFIVYIFLLTSIISFGDLNVLSGVNLVPFEEILRYEFLSEQFMINVVGNIVLFMPLGYFMGHYFKSKKAYVIGFIAGLISLTGEILQRYVGRSFDIDDIILNVSGAILGFLIYKVLHKLYRKLPNIFQKDGLYNLFCIIIIIVLILYVLNAVGVINIV